MIEQGRNVAAVVEEDGKVLVQKEGKGFSIPKIQVRGNETDEQALERSIKDQSGLQIRVESLLAEGKDTAYYLCSLLVPNQSLTKGQDKQPVFVPRLEAVSLPDSEATELPPGVVLHLTGASADTTKEREISLRVILPAEIDQFEELNNRWQQDTIFLSSPQVEHEAFEGIVAMREVAVPLILEKIRDNPLSRLHLALEEITGENPAEETDSDNLEEKNSKWLRWGEDRGYI